MIVTAPSVSAVVRGAFGSVWRFKLVRGNVMAAVTAVLVMAPGAMAQDKPKVIKPADIPESAFPPAGMCRVWLADVAERQQPAPTDCATAIRTMPRDATVLFGDLKRGATLTTPSLSLRAGLNAVDDPRTRARGLRSPLNEPSVSQSVRGNMTPTQAAAAAAAASARTAPGAGVSAVKAPETKAAIVKPPEPPPQH